MELVKIINELEEEFANSKSFLWSKKTLIDVEKCSSLLAELKANLPSSIQEASYVLAHKAEIISNASSEAKKIMNEAKHKASQLTSESEVLKNTEIEVNEHYKRTEQKCEELYSVTKENIDRLLASVQDYLKQNLELVSRNREKLDKIILDTKNKN